MLFLGIDWGEHHHDLCLLNQDGAVLTVRRITDGLAGVEELHVLVAAHAQDPTQVAVGIETDRGLLVGALLAAGYQVYAVNRKSSAATAAGTAAAGPSPTAATPRCWRPSQNRSAQPPPGRRRQPARRGGQGPGPSAPSLVWSRQRHANALRSALREFYPGALAALGAQLAEPEALAVLALAPTPEQGRQLTRAAIRQALVGAGRRRNLQARVVAVHEALAVPQLATPEPVAAAYREVVGVLGGCCFVSDSAVTG